MRDSDAANHEREELPVSEFGLDAEAINRYVAEKIAESSVGEALKTAIDAEVKRLTTAYDNPMKPVVANALAAVAHEYLATPEVKVRLREAVEAALTDEAVEGFISKIIAEGYRR